MNQAIYNPNLYYIDPRFLQLHGPVELLTELKLGYFTFQAQADYQIDSNSPVHEYDWSSSLIYQAPNRDHMTLNTLFRKRLDPTQSAQTLSLDAFKVLPTFFNIGGGLRIFSRRRPAVTANVENIPSPFSGSIKSINIVDDPTNNVYYGAILHQEATLDSGGGCTYPLIDDKISSCQKTNTGYCCNVNVPVASADIFVFDKSSASSGDGVSFYSEPYGWNTGARAGSYDVSDEEISPIAKIDAKNMCFDYTGVDRRFI